MSNQELCTQYELILALLDTGNVEKAKEILHNAIKRIDRGYTTSSNENENKEPLSVS